MFLNYFLLLLAFLKLLICSPSKQQHLSVNSFWNFEENAKRSERSVEVKLLDEEELLSITKTTPTSLPF